MENTVLKGYEISVPFLIQYVVRILCFAGRASRYISDK
jgi:hypothetical protein